MKRSIHSATQDARGFIAASLARNDPPHEILQDLLSDTRFEACFYSIDDQEDPEAIRREAVAMIHAAQAEREVWAA